MRNPKFLTFSLISIVLLSCNNSNSNSSSYNQNQESKDSTIRISPNELDKIVNSFDKIYRFNHSTFEISDNAFSPPKKEKFKSEIYVKINDGRMELLDSRMNIISIFKIVKKQGRKHLSDIGCLITLTCTHLKNRETSSVMLLTCDNNNSEIGVITINYSYKNCDYNWLLNSYPEVN